MGKPTEPFDDNLVHHGEPTELRRLMWAGKRVGGERKKKAGRGEISEGDPDS